MRIFYTIGLLLLFPLFVHAQSLGNLAGEVIDKGTQKPIAGAKIQLVNTKYVTTSDTSGKYYFKRIPTGQYHILITSLGTIPINLYNVIVTSGNLSYSTSELEPEAVTLKEVTVGNIKKTVRAATLETPIKYPKINSRRN